MQVSDLIREGRSEEILDLCNDILARNPDVAIAHQFKAMHFNDRGRHDVALGHCDDAIRCASQAYKPVYLATKAAMLYDAGKYDKALECADKTRDSGIDDQSLFSIKGLVLHQRYNRDPDPDLAKEILYYYDRALEYNPTYNDPDDITNPAIYDILQASYDDQTLHNKGLLLFDLKKYNAALECFEEELSTDPDNVETLINKATALYRVGKNEESIKCCRYLAKLDPQDPDILYSLCARFYGLELYDEALDTINTAINLDPSNPKGEKYRRVIESKLESKNS